MCVWCCMSLAHGAVAIVTSPSAVPVPAVHVIAAARHCSSRRHKASRRPRTQAALSKFTQYDTAPVCRLLLLRMRDRQLPMQQNRSRAGSSARGSSGQKGRQRGQEGAPSQQQAPLALLISSLVSFTSAAAAVCAAGALTLSFTCRYPFSNPVCTAAQKC